MPVANPDIDLGYVAAAQLIDARTQFEPSDGLPTVKDNAGLILAVEDSRARAQALVDLMLAADQQAATLLGIYLTVGTATATGAGAALVAGEKYSSVTAGLVVITVLMFTASIFCFSTMRRVALSNPGREPEFWLWAVDNQGVSLQRAAREYLLALSSEMAFNRKVNARSAWYLSVAKLIGVAAPPLGALASYLAYIAGVTVAWA